MHDQIDVQTDVVVYHSASCRGSETKNVVCSSSRVSVTEITFGELCVAPGSGRLSTFGEDGRSTIHDVKSTIEPDIFDEWEFTFLRG